MNSDSEVARGETGKQTLVAAFAGREDAHEAAKALRAEGFHKQWIGVTRADAPEIKSEDETIPAKIGRFFKGESDGSTLAATLTRHGVSEADAQRVEGQLEPNDVILTVDGSNHPELAARILEDCGGDLLSGESFLDVSVDWTPEDDRLGSELLGYEDPSEFARGKRVDDAGVTRLRNERLLIGIVPTVREDIFIASFDADDDADRSGIGSKSTRGT